MTSATRLLPNILVTGTPGVGKSTLCKSLAESTGLTWVEVSTVAKENNCLEKYDEVYMCPIIDEDKLLDIMEDMMTPGGKIVDYHSCDFFPERWFDIVFVLRTDNTILYDRLSSRIWETYIYVSNYGQLWLNDNTILKRALVDPGFSIRGYTGKKLEDNIDCEIFQIILDEATESYAKEIVNQLNNTTSEQLEDNLARISLWIQSWKEKNSPK